MKNLAIVFLTLITLTSCSSKETTTEEAREELLDKWTPKVGTATKSQFVEQFGTAEWCRKRDSGAETCRFYNKRGVKWMGDAKDRKSYVQYDQIIADFDGNGVLRSFEGDSQR